jgi:hypothetical protein
MKYFITITLTVAAALLLAACVTSSGGDGSGAVMSVNGREITAKELLSSPMMRQSIKQFLIADALMREAGKEGLTADEEAINDQIENIEQDALSQGMTIEEYLAQQFMTIEDVKESIRMQQMFNKLIEARSVVTDSDRDDYWAEHGDEVKYAHARDNHLTEAEATELTREDVLETLDERIRLEKENVTRQGLMEGLINGIDLKVLVFDSRDEAKNLEDLIINSSKTDQEEEEAGPADAGAGGATSSLGPGPGAGSEEQAEDAAAEDDGAAGDEAGEVTEKAADEAGDEAEAPAEDEAGGEEAEGEAETAE